MGVDWANLTDEQLDAVDELWNSAAVKEGDAQAVASTMADSAILTLRAIWPDIETLDGVELRQRLVEALPDVVEPHREASSAFAADYYETTRPAEAGAFAVVLARVLVFQDYRSMVGDAVSPMFQEVPNLVHTQEQVESGVERLVMDGFRGTVQSSVEADPAALGWKRTLSPKACDFCVRVARENPRSNQAFGSHDHCRCTARPVFRSV